MALAAELIKLLQRTNPWLFNPKLWNETWTARMPDPFLLRSMPSTIDQTPINKVCLVVGPRQAGKSTLLWHRVQAIGPDLLMVNCEEPLFQAWCGSPATFWAEVQENLPRPASLLFEEVQHLDQAGLFLKGLADLKPGLPIYATGSSSFHLMARTRESLAGRAVRARLLPFSLAEVCTDLQEQAPAVAAAEKRSRLERMLIYGGYPEPWLADDPGMVLAGLVEGVVIRDASDLFRIDRPDAFRRLLKLMAGQVGNLVNLSEWAAICGVSVKTVQRYAGILEEAHIVSLVQPWNSGKRTELTGTPKVFFVDNGIRNAVLSHFSAWPSREDRGALLENWVLTEILKSLRPVTDGIGFWRTKAGAEVDFVVERGNTRIGVEVKASSTRPVLPRAARSFIQAARPSRFIMLYMGDACEQEIEGCQVVWTTPTEFDRWLRTPVQ